MIKKLEKYNAKPATINAFKKESQKIINSDYKIIDRLKQLNNTIGENPTIFAARKLVISQNLTSKYSKKLNLITSF